LSISHPYLLRRKNFQGCRTIQPNKVVKTDQICFLTVWSNFSKAQIVFD
jgi:hypothetical protein